MKIPFPPLLLLLLSILPSILRVSHANNDSFNIDLPGPTLAQRIPAGYELKNRHVLVVLDEKTGDVIYWGSPDGTKNLFSTHPARVAVSIDNAWTTSTPDGYIEPRDDQTWQYLGHDKSNELSWRKIYCLDGDHLNISILAQNQRPTPCNLTMALDAGPNPFPISPTAPDAEHFDGATTTGTIHLHSYNEAHDLPAHAPYLLVSDPHTLKPGERISWTMQWTCHN